MGDVAVFRTLLDRAISSRKGFAARGLVIPINSTPIALSEVLSGIVARTVSPPSY
jgi:hypothetical protein